MQLSELCPICLPQEYNPTKYDEYGDVVVPKLCDDEKILEESVISSVVVQKIKQKDTMMEANISVITSKNKLYCGEQ